MKYFDIYFIWFILILTAAPSLPSADINKKELSKIPKSFRVAIISAGSLRSFAYVARSWQRYLLRPWKGQIFVFAHVIHDKDCIVDQKGLNLLREIATEIEISSQVALLPYEYLAGTIPKVFERKIFYTNKLLVQRGNVIDMLQRRNRAYQLSQIYASNRNFTFDFVVFIRPDSAIYHPPMDFLSWYHHIQSEVRRTSSHSSQRLGAIYIPRSCNFGGVCDRFAAGLPIDMDVYFKSGWILEVMRWAFSKEPEKYPVINPEVLESQISKSGKYTVKDIIANLRTGEFFSERLHMYWLLLNNITQIDYEPGKYPLAFITLRTRNANFYCESNRSTYLANEDVDFADRFPAFAHNHASEYGGFDHVASAIERCGYVHTLNASAACSTSRCTCNDGRKKGVDF